MDGLRHGTAILVAIGVHLIVAASIGPAPVIAGRAVDPRDPIELRLLEPIEASPSPSLPPPETPSERAVEPAPGPRSRARAPLAVEPTRLAPEGAAVADEAPIAETPDPRETRETLRPRPSLDPRDVAASWLPLDSSPGSDARRAAVRAGPAVPTEAELERGLSEDLRRHAMTKAHVSPRREIDLHARTDGSYEHQGDGFHATIRPDGTVEFRDRAAVAVEPPTMSTLRDGRIRSATEERVLPELMERPGGLIETAEPPPLIVGIGGRFDLQGEIMRGQGHDPHQAERLHFLEETEELRDQLTDRHVAAQRARALDRLPARLSRLWGDRSRPAAARRAAIFAMWDQCAEDEEDGRTARARIERFVREHLPAGSEDAFPEDELRALNASRASEAAWSPY